MKIFILSLCFSLLACKNLKYSQNASFSQSSVHTISKNEDSSKTVQAHLQEPYVSSYGEIEIEDNKQINKWIHYFQTRGRERMMLYLSRSSRYIDMMKNVFREYKLPERLVYVAMIESGFSPRAHSYANAVGYWQFIVGTGKRYGLKVNSYIDERRDPVLSTRAAAEYFKDLYGIFGSWHLALASYNAGEYRVNRSVMRHYTRDFWYLSSKKSFPKETINYVPKFMSAVKIAENPKKYGFMNIDYQEPLNYSVFKLDFPINLNKLSKELNVPYKTLHMLNPRYRSEYVPVSDETIIRIPFGKEQVVASLITKCRASKPNYVHSDFYWHRIKRGDTLYRLARRNRTTISTLRRLNRMRSRSSILRVGRKIKIPLYNNRVAKKGKASPRFHLVRRGESLTQIAKKYRLKLSNLKQMNRIKGSVIHPGQRLRLSKRKRFIAKTSKRKLSPPKGRVYIVQKGDTLIGIAKKYNVSLPRLMEKNSLNFQSIIIAGHQLFIPR